MIPNSSFFMHLRGRSKTSLTKVNGKEIRVYDLHTRINLRM